MRTSPYIATYLDKKLPLLLGFSGGPDSLALAHYLKNLGFVLELAHFDHGWRKKSQLEADLLKKWAESQKLPFHLGKGYPVEKSELEAREQRFAFFKDLYSQKKYGALVLAHHMQDRAETILKRIFEGAKLSNLKGMQEIADFEGMAIWRPMIKTPKKKILTYLEEQRLNPLEDPSNSDPRYLRARMRQEIFPELSKTFGKEVAPALIQIGDYAAELHDYLNIRCAKYLPKQGVDGVAWDFSGAHPLEIRTVLNHYFPREISAKIFKQIFKMIGQGGKRRRIVFGNKELIIHHNRVIFPKNETSSSHN